MLELKKKISKSALQCLMIAISLFLAVSGYAAEKVYEIRIQSQYPKGDLSLDVLPEFANAIEKKSKGRLKVKIYASGELYPGYDSLSVVQNGSVEMAQGSGNLFGQVQPMGQIEFGLPKAFSVEEVDGFVEKAETIKKFFYTSGLIDLIRAEYAKAGLFYLGPNTFGAGPVLLSRTKVEKCSDMQGKIVRTGGGLVSYHAAVGLKGTDINPMETYMALKMGTLDMADYDISGITGLKWHEVAPYWIRGMENDHLLGSIIVNLKWWNKLPIDLQAVILSAHSNEYWDATLYGYEEEEKKAYALVEKGEVILNDLPQECIELYAAQAIKVWDDESEKGPANRAAVSLLKEWHGMK